MKKAWIVGIWFLFVSGHLLVSAKDERNEFLDEARKLEARKATIEAEQSYRLAIGHARQKLSEQALSDAMYSLGQFYRRIGRHSDAVTELSDSLRIQEHLTGGEDVRTGRRLAELAAAYLQNREVGEARAVLGKLKPIASKYRGEEKKFVDGLFKAMDELTKSTDKFLEISAAAAKGDREARYALAACYEDGIGVTADSRKALELFSALANQGHLESQFYMGVMYDKARGVSRDAVKAAEWYGKAAEGGLAVAQYNYAVFLAAGDGVPKNLAEALHWAKKAQEGKYPGATRAVTIIERDLATQNAAAPGSAR
ncbi:MAG: tetratricopeptide repeat protein [bacterium]|nr:tetratricopeptide repeat protein [bacterium]MDI1335484.1 tetratricopeptide repeat protein [Lacunisphaera sp.]